MVQVVHSPLPQHLYHISVCTFVYAYVCVCVCVCMSLPVYVSHHCSVSQYVSYGYTQHENIKRQIQIWQKGTEHRVMPAIVYV